MQRLFKYFCQNVFSRNKLHYFLNNKKRLEQLEKIAKPLILKELTKLIKEKKPNVIVSVHPLVNHLTVQALKELNKKIPFIVMVMDPVTIHRAWVTPDPDLYIFATKEAKEFAIEYGLPSYKGKVIGLPVDPKFTKNQQNKKILREKEGLDPNLFTILIMGGGEGAGGIHKIVQAINYSKIKGQLIVIAGRNKKLKEKLEKETSKTRIPTKIYGFTDHVPKIMAQSDIIITKGGPGAIAEAIAISIPMIITSWLPGQEEGNIQFVKENNLGYIQKDPEKIVKTIKELQIPSSYTKIVNNIKRRKNKNAVFDIAANIAHYL